jgi:hypothetical protein
MTLTITIPNGDAKVKNVMGNGTICVRGTSLSNGVGANVVRAKVYVNQIANPPATPPGDATAGTPGKDYAFDAVTGATSSAAAPYPDNTVVVWAGYPGNPNVWENAYTYFGGMTSANTDCT